MDIQIKRVIDKSNLSNMELRNEEIKKEIDTFINDCTGILKW